MLRYVHRLSFTIAFLAVMLAANIMTETFGGVLPAYHLQGWGLSLDGLMNGEVFRLITAVFLSHDIGMFFRQFLFAASVIGIYEWLNGSGRAIAMFLFTDIVSTIVFFILLISILSFGSEALSGIAARHDVGMSGGGFGLLGALAASRRRHGLIFIAVVAGLAGKLVIWPDLIADGLHLVAFPVGYLAARFLASRERQLH